MEPTKIPCLAKGISLGSGLTWRRLGLLLLDSNLSLLASETGILLVVITGILWLVALLLLLLFSPERFKLIGGLLSLIAAGGPVELLSLCSVLPVWPASWLLVVDKGRGSKSVEVQRVWEVYDERLQFMSRQDALLLDEALGADDVSRAWACLVWGC